MTLNPDDALPPVTTTHRASAAAGGWTVPLFTAAAFVGAALVFLTEPMVVKMVLPRLGGSPSVWSTAMVFFQAVLLAGYLYAHLASTRLGLRRQTLLHLPLLALPLVVLPMALPGGWRPPTQGSPIPWLAFALIVIAGLPYFVVTTASPLLQRWFSASGHRWAHDPYFLYAAGNAGSLLGLLTYPVLIEPRLTLGAQARLWTALYLLFVVLSAAAALAVRRRPLDVVTVAAAEALPAAEAAPLADTLPAADPPPSGGARRWLERGRWVALAFIPSSLMLGVTTHLSVDVASVPLLWVLPLSVYLLTFIIAFGRRNLFPVGLAAALTPLAVAVVVTTMLLRVASLLLFTVVLLLVALFVIGMLCHGRLAAERPPANRLTGFFLLTSLGGVAGGAFNALAAPLLFNRVLEFPLALGLALAARRGRRRGSHARRARLWPVVAAVGVVVAPLVATKAIDWARDHGSWVILGVALAVAVVTLPSKWVSLAAVGSLLAYATFANQVPPTLRERTFFGVLTVDRDTVRTSLSNGTTLHGNQFVDPAKAVIPTTYYAPSGPLGQLFSALKGRPQLERVGVVGLGTGTAAAYADAGMHLTYFEIDPAVARIAQDPNYFTYISDARGRGAQVDVTLGDARLSLDRVPNATFGMLALDAFSSDAIPVHLLTREAVALYLDKLTPDGVLMVHISNRWLRLEQPLAAIVDDLGVPARIFNDMTLTTEEDNDGKTLSTWVAISRDSTSLALLDGHGDWQPLQTTAGVGAWTDDFSNIFQVLRRRWWR